MGRGPDCVDSSTLLELHEQAAEHLVIAFVQRELRSVDAYLERMGVRDPLLRARVEDGLPWAQPGSGGMLNNRASVLKSDSSPWLPLNTAAVALVDAADGEDNQNTGSLRAPLFLFTDGTGGEVAVCGVLADMGRACFVLRETQARRPPPWLSC